ncbi:MAG: hypothetical protein GY843_12265 [Neptuniibacter sp.]|nr:hypothetical protein [Neptuniibacter sp.]
MIANNNLPTGSVTITGSPIQGEVLSASNNLIDEDGLGEISYQWIADDIEIDGATSEQLLLSQIHVGKEIKVLASYVDQKGTNESVTSLATSSVSNVNDDPVGTVTISGNLFEGETLTILTDLSDLDGLGVLSYQWKADGDDIPDATASMYQLTSSEIGKQISVATSYIDL